MLRRPSKYRADDRAVSLVKAPINIGQLVPGEFVGSHRSNGQPAASEKIERQPD